MRILERYIGRSVAVSVMVVMLVLLGLYIFTAFTGEFSNIGHGSYTLWNALEYILSQIPRRIYDFFPLAALLGTMIGLGGLASSSELVAVRAAGVSLTRIVIAVMKTGLILMVVAVFVGEVVAPPMDQYVNSRRIKQLAEQITLNTSYGLWARDGSTFINIRRVEDNGRLVGINLYQFGQHHQLQIQTHADSARYQGDAWRLHTVRRSIITAAGVRVEHLAQLTWKTRLNPALISVVSESPQILPFWRLYTYVQYLHRNGLDASRYELTLWQKAMAPLTIAVMVLLAVPFVFGSLRSVGMGARILVGFLVGVGFYMLNQIAGHAGLVYHLPPALSATGPTVLAFGFALYLLRRVF